jgi:hypothetical protein
LIDESARLLPKLRRLTVKFLAAMDIEAPV